jgi:anti-sigma regulatory factor (Ser/Thr protein kinase)
LGTAAELTLGRDPDAVPKSRRFVRSSLGGEDAEMIQDTELVVTELVTNALLHGEPPVRIRLLILGARIRVEVEDNGRAIPIRSLSDPDAMTGRGLALIASLADRWGVDPGRAGGKVVWAEIAAAEHQTGRPALEAVPQISREVLAASLVSPHQATTYLIRLVAVPTALMLSAKAHIDNVVRELTLVRGGESGSLSPLAPAMALLVASVTGEFAEARAEIKRQALAAAAGGAITADIELRLPLSYADAGERYLIALDEADRYAREAHLLTLAPPASHRVFREWYVGSLVAQLRARAAGREPDHPEPLASVLARRLDELDAMLRDSTRPTS